MATPTAYTYNLPPGVTSMQAGRGTPVAVPTAATLSGPTAATAGAAVTHRVTIDAVSASAYTVTWARSNGGTGNATSTIAPGQTFVDATSTWAAAGAGRTLDFTISPTLTRSGNPITIAVAALLPTWLAGQPLNTWISIPGTSGAGGSAINAFSMFVVKQSTSELISAASGGHTDSYDNGVYSIRLTDNAPAWVTRKASSGLNEPSVLYYSDGLPTSRHTYQHNHYIPSLDAVLMAGCRFGYGGAAPEGPGMDLFSLSTNQWLPRYTYPDIPAASGYGIVKDGSGGIWTTSGKRFDTATSTWAAMGISLPRFPSTYDSLRDQIFSLQCGNGEDGVQTVVSQKVVCSTAVKTTITFNASAALTQFTTAGALYLGMDYDAPNDRFLATHQGEAGVVYTITPNSSSVWDMGILSVSGSVSAGTGGTQKKFQFISNLNGFALITQAASAIYFLRTA